MKKQSGKFEMKTMLFTIILILGILCPAFMVSDLDEKVKTAYTMRLSGKVDEAKALLDEIIVKDSTNALAWYELARTQHHMMLGGGGFSPGDILATINKAVQYDNDNVIFAYYKANICFLNAYASQGNTNDYVTQSCETFNKVLKLNPDYKEAILSLVEIYGLLPAEMGGDKVEAQKYAKSLEELDKFYFARANSVLLEEDTDKIAYWENILKDDPKSSKINEELGKTCFLNGDIEKGTKYMKDAMTIDPKNNLPQLNIARAHVMMVMQSKGDKDTNLKQARNAFNKYIEIGYDNVSSLKAYTLGWEAKIKGFQGDSEGAENLIAEAKLLDPYFSKAFGVPAGYLFTPPDEVSSYFSSFFSPF